MAIEDAWGILEKHGSDHQPLSRSYDRTGLFTATAVLNSASDIAAIGDRIAARARLPVWLTIMLGVAFRTFHRLAVRDNLTLNVLMLSGPWRASGCGKPGG
jgi:hypothetical protein